MTGVGGPINFMNNYRRPILLGGQLKAEGSRQPRGWHFVTAYGYHLEGAFTQKLIAHFGWQIDDEGSHSIHYVDGIWTQVVGIRSE